MKEITVQLTEKQEAFLKLFAEKHFPGSDDNCCTGYPIHVVETKKYMYIPYSIDTAWVFEGTPLTFTTDEAYESWFDDEVELVKDWYECRGEECLIEIKPYKEMEFKKVETTDDEIFITSYDDYFEVYGVKLHAMAWKKEYYDQVAFFFIRDEAKRYIEYQGHNLNKPRVYTYGPGYANKGDFTYFWELLMSMGQQLKSGEEVKA